MAQSPVIVGIAGGSGAGKTTLAREMAAALSAPVLSLDLYYRDLSNFSPAERAEWNFDHPAALEWDLLVSHVESLAAGIAIEAPVYDFATHTRRSDTQRVESAGAIVVEGIHALHEPALRASYLTSVFVDAPEHIRLARRLERDVLRRGRTAEYVREQFERTVRPMHAQFVEPAREYAAWTADGENAFAPVVERILGLTGAAA